MTEVFHDEPVHHLKFHCSVVNPAKQELTVLYQKTLIIIEGLGLLNSLRACRSYIAKGCRIFILITVQYFELSCIAYFFILN